MNQAMKKAIHTHWAVRIFSVLALVLISVSAGAVDINRANAQELAESLQQIGIAKAQAIIEYREKHGAFRTVDDLQKVSGIGPKLLEMNRAQIEVGKAGAKTDAKTGAMPNTANRGGSVKHSKQSAKMRAGQSSSQGGAN